MSDMCKIIEDMRKEERAEARVEERTEVALRMLKDGTLLLDKIAQFANLPLEEIAQLKKKVLS